MDLVCASWSACSICCAASERHSRGGGFPSGGQRTVGLYLGLKDSLIIFLLLCTRRSSVIGSSPSILVA